MGSHLRAVARMTTQHLERLPTEILVKVLECLGFQDLLKVSEVSKKLHSLATDPMLWKSFEPSDYLQPEALLAILQLERFSKLETLHLNQGKKSLNAEIKNLQVVKIFQSIESLELKHLTIHHFDLTSLDPSLLSRVLNNTECVSLNHCVDVSDEQMVRTVEEMTEKSKVKGLQVERRDFSRIESKSLSKAINSLENFYSLGCEYSNEQLDDIFEAMATDTNLKDLSLFAVNGLERVLPGTFAKAFNNLESIYIGHPLTPGQLFGFFEQLSSSKSCLKKLLFMFKDSYQQLLAFIPSDVLSKGLNKLDTVVMPNLMLTNTQIKEMLEGVARSSSCVKSLDLGKNNIPELGLDMLKNIVTKLDPNSFKLHLQGKILEIYENTLESLKKNLMEKWVRQAELQVESKRLKEKEKALKSRLSLARKLKNMNGRLKVTVCKKSKLSSSFRFSAKSRILKKTKIVLKVKLLK